VSTQRQQVPHLLALRAQEHAASGNPWNYAMPAFSRRRFLEIAGSSAFAMPALSAALDTPHGLVSGQPHAAKAGNDVLADGGNAADAMVAAALVGAVVALPSCGIGGYGGHAVVATPDGKVTAIDFNTTAPAAARDDMFPLDEAGKVRGQVNSIGWKAAGVPGTVAGIQLLAEKFGTRPLGKLLKPAITFARDGVELTKNWANAIKTYAPRFKMDEGSARLFLKNGEPPAEGTLFKNPDLADLLQAMADKNSFDDFYRGAVARRIADGFRKNGDLVTIDDLAAYRAREMKPLSLEWRGATIHTAPLAAGGLTVQQVMTTLRAIGWDRFDRADPKTTHARLEAQRVAWHDRLTLLGDPEKGNVPVERLLSNDYAEKTAERVRAAVKDGKSLPAASDGRPMDGTIHLTAVDGRGMMVALTLTHGEGFGACVTVDGLGLTLGHGMSRFDARPKHPNSPGPGKRPLHNMCPTVVSRDGRPVVALGAAGGRRIPNTLLDVLLYHVALGRPLEESVESPRLHTEGDTNVKVEAAWPAVDVAYLKKVGYTVTNGPGASLNAIGRDPKSGELTTAAR
jgi:gamma-glutamyltranspeptidase/glutathione hydrolase